MYQIGYAYFKEKKFTKAISQFNQIIGENNSNNDLGFALTDSMVAAISKFNGVIVLPSKTSSYISENNYNDEIRRILIKHSKFN